MMNDCDIKSACDIKPPSAPFLEKWAFRVIVTPSPAPPTAKGPKGPREIRSRVLEHLHELSGSSMEPDIAGQEIRKAIVEIVEDRLSGPDFRFFVTDFEERAGSLEVFFAVVGVFVGGVCGYG